MTYRIFVEKKPSFQVEAQCLRQELNENLKLNLTELRYINVYDLEGFSEELLKQAEYTIFGERVTDNVMRELKLDMPYLAVEPLPGQFDQRASSAVDCVHLLDPEANVEIHTARLLLFTKDITPEDLNKIRHYYINAVESREKDMSVLSRAEEAEIAPMRTLPHFTEMKEEEFAGFCSEWGLAMNTDDLREVINYFRNEHRQPTETEIKILDTYWSDHCRHTTFTTELETIHIDESFIRNDMEESLELFHKLRHDLGRDNKSVCLMELATIGARYLRKIGKLDDMEVSEENNACSIFVEVDVDGKMEKWLLQFKNETHNHPTEIEPFGGASTCLGGAIRDPLSGRAFVYQAMRVTGAGNIYQPVEDTLKGKLPQQIITHKAAAGYSSYGNQIGLATTHLREIYHPSYVAKRMEVGAVVGAVKAENVRRETPTPGDVILLLGGRTGRDGIGGATGASKAHTKKSLDVCGSEVQKGNAPEERKLQRLFRRDEVTRLIKKSNDFGAGGVSVAIGELADGLDIYLDRVPVKYAGLNPTELAISESQERVAIVVEKKDQKQMEEYCHRDNVEVTYVADVTDTARMRIYYHQDLVADLSREFIDSAGAKHYTNAVIEPVEEKNPFFRSYKGSTLQRQMESMLEDDNITSQKGLIEQFDATIGRSTVLMPYGGESQMTETQVSVQKLPVDGFTHTASMMAFGYNPFLSEWSPYHGAAYAVVDACAKVVAAGGDYSHMRFSYQEYFQRMTTDPHTYGKPLAALLGALKMQVNLELPSIGGKDSMSGTFEHINVPPTLIAFGVTTVKDTEVISPEWKAPGQPIYLLQHRPLANYMPNTDQLKRNWNLFHEWVKAGMIQSAYALSFGGVAEALSKAAFGNHVGVNIHIAPAKLFNLCYGSLIFSANQAIDSPDVQLLGYTTDGEFLINDEHLDLARLEKACFNRFASIYPTHVPAQHKELMPSACTPAQSHPAADYPGEPVEHPVVFIPTFPGTNCDLDSAKAFRTEGADVHSMIFRNLTSADVQSSINEMAHEIDSCHILMLSGGFSAGDEPDGSGKFIAAVLNNRLIAEAIDRLIERGGLILGICNGFQALIKSGLLPYGKTGMLTATSPTLFRNDINRHVSQMVTTVCTSVASPWLRGMREGDAFTIAVSHGEGKFVVSEEEARSLFMNHQVAFRYADPVTRKPTMASPANPNGSYYAIEGILSANGQILGKMAHSERYEEGVFRNISGHKRQPLFQNAVRYFQKR